jgi:hypothetical protein
MMICGCCVFWFRLTTRGWLTLISRVLSNHGDGIEQISRNDQDKKHQHKCIIIITVSLATAIVHGSPTALPLRYIKEVELRNQMLTNLRDLYRRCGIKDSQSKLSHLASLFRSRPANPYYNPCSLDWTWFREFESGKENRRIFMVIGTWGYSNTVITMWLLWSDKDSFRLFGEILMDQICLDENETRQLRHSMIHSDGERSGHITWNQIFAM